MSAPMEEICQNDSEGEGVEKELTSRLGTKEHWDSVFERELAVFHDIKDVGHIWYGEKSMERILKWMYKNITDKNTSILDLGCGNGLVLIELAKKGYTTLTGLDYSQSAIQLAKSVAKEEQLNITYKEANILNPDFTDLGSQKYDVCIDKGTYDAILLADCDRNQLRKLYREHIDQLLGPNGTFIIVSVNYVHEELTQYFMPEFEVRENIPASSFTFGGKKGSNITTLIFQKRTI